MAGAPRAADVQQLFAAYNESVWPAEHVLAIVAVAALAAAIRRQSTVPVLALSLLWAWAGVVYHVMYFSDVTPAGFVFGAAFTVQALLFVGTAVRRPLSFNPRVDLKGISGAFIAAFAIFGYPLVGKLIGHAYPAAPLFGAPCPITLFTLGLLLWAENVPARLLAIPIGWAVVGGSAAFLWGFWHDLAMPFAAVLVSGVFIRSRIAMASSRQLHFTS